jgi:surfactin synthase thioesterase subunit
LQDDLTALAGQLADEIHDELYTTYALFGHSLGAVLAFELARALRDRGSPAPAALFASGTAAPSRRDDSGLAGENSDAELIERLRRFKGTPEEVFANDELMRLTLPVLRADFRMLSRYRHRAGPPLECPIHVLGGRDDAATLDQLLAWRVDSAPGFSLSLFDGGHFFIHESQGAVLALVRDRLQAVPPRYAAAEQSQWRNRGVR